MENLSAVNKIELTIARQRLIGNSINRHISEFLSFICVCSARSGLLLPYFDGKRVFSRSDEIGQQQKAKRK